MALKGSFYSYPVGGSSEFGLYCEWSAEQNAKENYSTITLKTYLSYYTISINATTAYSSINGKEVSFTMPAISKSSASSWTKKLVNTQTYDVYHDSNGTKTGVTLYASWGFHGTYSGVSIGVIKASTTISLDAIDQKPPTITLAVNNVTTNSVGLFVVASSTCDKWWYSTNGGSSWVNFSNTSGTSVSYQITGLGTNVTYNIMVSARREYNQIDGYSAQYTVRTLGGSLFNSCDNFYVDASTAQIKPNVTVYDSGATHKITFKDGGTNLFSISNLSWTAGTDIRTVSLTAAQKKAILDTMPNAKARTFNVVIETYSGSVVIGSASRVVTAETTESNSRPSWASPYMSWQDTSSAVSITGNSTVMIQEVSKLVVTASGVSARNSASISSYTVTIGGQTVTSKTSTVTVGAVMAGGTLQMRMTVTDSRGYSTTVTKDITVLPYNKPKMNSITLRRANGVDTMIQLAFTASISELKVNGTNDVNAFKSVSYKYFLTSSNGNSASAIDITSKVNTSIPGMISYETNQLIDLDIKRSYYISLVISDKVSTATYTYLIPMGTPLLAVRKDKLGINNADPQYTLDVDGSINVTGDIYKNGKSIVKSDTEWAALGMTNNIYPTSEGKGHYPYGFRYKVTGENHVYVEFGGSFAYSGSPIQVNSAPIPAVYQPKSFSPQAIVPASDSGIARIYVDVTTGCVMIDWAHDLVDASNTYFGWIDGCIDYFID